MRFRLPMAEFDKCTDRCVVRKSWSTQSTDTTERIEVHTLFTLPSDRLPSNTFILIALPQNDDSCQDIFVEDFPKNFALVT